MRIYSNISIARIFKGVMLGGWIILLSIIVANHTLSCVDKKGCLRTVCNFNWLKPAYQKFVLANSASCPYQNTTNYTAPVTTNG